jgi:DNA polymerase-4
VAEVAPVIEDRGIDEIYIDLSEVPGVRDAVGHDPLGGVKAVAREIKNSVTRATGLSCSIGVTPNKLLSKIASELDKPDGITVLTLADIPTRIWPLAVRKVNGIGPKASDKLAALGLHTVGELAAAPPPLLIEHFGASFGAWLHNAAHGRDARPVVTRSEPVSISRETTFERDLHVVRDKARLGAILDGLCESLERDLARKGYAGKTVGVKLRFEGFVTVTRDHTLKAPIRSAAEIRAAVGHCLKRVSFDKRMRLLGVRIGNLVSGQEVAAAAAGPAPAPTAREDTTLPLF